MMLLTLGFSSMSVTDIVWAMSKVGGSYLPGGVSDAMYLSCYVWLAAAAREQLRGAPPARRAPSAFSIALMQGMPYIAMMVSFLVLVYVERSAASSPVNTMSVIVFVLTALVMVRQGVLLRDDALLSERRAAGLVEARYASLIKHASDVIMITDAQGQLRFASPAAERTFAMHPEHLVGRTLLDLWADGERERVAAFLSEVAATRGRTIGPVEAVVESGDRHSTLECVGSNLTDDPAVAGLALSFRDVSERKALEEQLRKLGGSLAWAAALILSAGPLLLAQEDVQRHPSCKNCGMARTMFAHSRMLVEYEDGSSVGVCSLHCAALELALNIGTMPKSVQVGDHNTKALVDAEKASWVIGGSKPGVMTDRAKWAFRDPADAKRFKAEFGGTVAVFDQAVKAAFEDMYKSWKVSWDKRKKMLEEMR